MAQPRSGQQGGARERAKKYAKGKYVPNPYRENEIVRDMIGRAENVLSQNELKD